MDDNKKKAREIFEEMKPRCELKRLSGGMEMYTTAEGNFEYTFYTSHGELKKVEVWNHRELIEVWF